MKFVKKDIPPFLKLNGLLITFVVSFNDVRNLQLTMYVNYLLINVIMSLKLDNGIKAD
jgi:hypothetical protein